MNKKYNFFKRQLKKTLAVGVGIFAFTNTQAQQEVFRDLEADKDHYTLFSLSTGDTVDISDSNSTSWDLGFKGTTIILNGGVFGSGSITGQIIEKDFDDVMMAPNDGYITDETSEYTITTGSGNGWYTYSGSPAHKIEPIAGKTILIKTADGNYAKMEIISYYQGNIDLNQYTTFPPSGSKHYTFRYFLQADGSPRLNHSSERTFADLRANGDDYALFSLSLNDTIPLSDSNSNNWDLGFSGTTIILNSGILGGGEGEALVLNEEYVDVAIAPKSGYEMDSIDSKAINTGSGNGWYAYAGHPTHIISPLDSISIIVKTNDDKFAKIEIMSYYEGNPDLSQYTDAMPTESSKHYTFKYFIQEDGSAYFSALPRGDSVCMDTLVFCNLNAKKEVYTYFSLDNRDTVAHTDSNSTNWDVSFKGTSILVNSGTSGPGTCVGQLISTAYDAITEAPENGYEVDAEGAPAIMTGSGNWYNYTGSPTHQIQMLDGKTIIVRSNEDNFFKIKMISYYLDNPDLNQYTAGTPHEPSRYYTFKFEQIDGPEIDFDTISSLYSIELIESSMNIYPNPTNKGNVELEFNTGFENELTTIQILDIKGQVVYINTIIGSQTVSISANKLDRGIYIVSAQNNQSLKTQRLIVQ
jgi:hypothetical protein